MTDSPNTMNLRGSPPWRVITHKEKEPMSTNLNRRALVAGAVTALPAIAVLPAAALNASGNDPELIKLSQALEPLFVDYMANSCEWARRARLANAEVSFPGNWQELTRGEQDADRAARSAAHERTGSNAFEHRMSELAERIEPLVEDIVDAETTSLAGLRAKALAVLWELRPYRTDSTGFDFSEDGDGGASRALFDVVAEMTGLTHMVSAIEDRLSAAMDAEVQS
jgi:hypothetical protein